MIRDLCTGSSNFEMRWKQLSRRADFVLLVLILVAFALRVFRIAVPDIWWDEARNIFTASRPPELIAAAPELDIHPPFYFYGLHLWMLAAGMGEFAVRFFSTFWGVALVPLVYCLGCFIRGRMVGLWAALFCALSPLLVDEAQQTRMYTLLLFLAALSMYFLLRALNKPEPHLWAAYVLSAAASFYTHYSFVYILLAQNLYVALLLVTRWRQDPTARGLLKAWMVCQAAIAALYLVQLPNILRQAGIYGNPGMNPPPLPQYVSELTSAFLLGMKIEPDALLWRGAGVIVVALIALAGTWLYRRETLVRRGGWLILLWFLVPVVAYFGVLQVSPQFTPRYGMVALVPLYLLVAVGLAAMTRHSAAAGALSLVLVVLSYAPALQTMYFSPSFANEDTRGLARFIAETATPEDIVVVDVPFPFFYYYHGAAPAQYLFVDVHSTADELTRLAEGKKRIYAVRWYKSDTDPRGYVQFLLDKYATYGGEQSFRGYDVIWYDLAGPTQFELGSERKATSAVYGDKLELTEFAFGGAVAPGTPNPDGKRVSAGSKAWVALWWRATQPPGRDYKVSVVLRDEAGNTVAQDDRVLLSDKHLPTRLWTPGEVAINVYTPELDASVPPGRYEVGVIVYDAETGERLQTNAGDAFEPGTLRVVEIR